LGIRRRFGADLKKRFLAIRKATRKAIVEKDALGLNGEIGFLNPYKIEEFLGLVRRLEHWAGLPVRGGVRTNTKRARLRTNFSPEPWSPTKAPTTSPTSPGGTDVADVIAGIVVTAVVAAATAAIAQSYAHGGQQAATNVGGSGGGTSSKKGDEDDENKYQIVGVFGGGPMTDVRVAALVDKTLGHISGLTAQMEAEIRAVLIEGIKEGVGAEELARRVADRIDIASSRAERIARTEIIGANAQGALDQYRRLGVRGVELQAEFATAGDDQVCVKCEELAGKVYTLDEAEGVIPVHPNCRCAWLPVATVPDAPETGLGEAVAAGLTVTIP
jgi:SPP1 gp7 family putative phage head morphogenesis protein